MKKIAVISDTHDILRLEVVSVAKSCDGIIHAGDFTRESILDALRPLGSGYVVRGNNDRMWTKHLKDTLRFQIGGVSFFLTHDRRNVAGNLDGVDVVIFGHTHKYFQEMINGRLWLNPGSCGRPRFGGGLSMAVMEINEEDHTWTVEKIPIPG